MPFVKASKRQAKLRLALIGPSGSGKTYTALRIATALGGKVAVIDTERGSASKYADEFSFDVVELDSFHPQRYIDTIHEAETAGYDVLIVDSLSHAWMGKDGALELVDRASKRMGGNKFTAWGDVTPLQQQLIDAMIGAKLHVIATVRSKMEYVQEKDDRGKTTIRKVGMQPVQRDGLEYEFDVVGDMDQNNTLAVTKTRCQALNGAVIDKPGPEVAATLKAWLTDGAEVVEPAKPEPTQTARPAVVIPPPASPRNSVEQAICAECKQPVKGTKIGATFFNSREVADRTRKAFGRTLCFECGQKAQQPAHDSPMRLELVSDPTTGQMDGSEAAAEEQSEF